MPEQLQQGPGLGCCGSNLFIFIFFNTFVLYGGDFAPNEIPCAGDNLAVCHVAGRELMCKC